MTKYILYSIKKVFWVQQSTIACSTLGSDFSKFSVILKSFQNLRAIACSSYLKHAIKASRMALCWFFVLKSRRKYNQNSRSACFRSIIYFERFSQSMLSYRQRIIRISAWSSRYAVEFSVFCSSRQHETTSCSWMVILEPNSYGIPFLAMVEVT